MTKCRCGRNADKIHCPRCGSGNQYARKALQDANGRIIARHVCRACGREFMDGEDCGAPFYTSVAELRQMRRAVASAKPNPERRALLENLFKNVKREEGG